MTIKRRACIALFIIIGVSAYPVYFIWRFRSPVPEAHSDVPIRHLAFAPGTEPPEILDISASIVKPLYLGIPPATEFVLCCRIRCRVQGVPERRPTVESAESSYRCVERGDFNRASVAAVVFNPIIKTVIDHSYEGGATELNVKLEEVVSTMSFGVNRYEIQVGNKTARVEVFHDKGGSHVVE